MKICPKCNAENVESNKFCSECGVELTSEVSKNKANNKAIKIIGLIIGVIIILYALIILFADFTGVSELHYKATIILPAIMGMSLLACGIVGVIASVKLNKKFFIFSISLLVVSALLFFGCKIVNPMITTKNAAPANESESVILSYKGDCDMIPYDDLLNNSKEYKKKQIVYVGEVITIVDEDNQFSEYVIDVTYQHVGYGDEMYVIYPHAEENSVKLEEGDIVAVYGKSYGLYNYLNNDESNLMPKVEARYIECY